MKVAQNDLIWYGRNFTKDNVTYFDYSATTPVNAEVLESFCKAATNYIANPNSLHKLGVKANSLIEKSTEQIAELLGVKTNEIIYTSGSSESNNLAIKGIADKYNNPVNSRNKPKKISIVEMFDVKLTAGTILVLNFKNE